MTKLGRMVSLLRRRPFDTSTEQGRSDERYRRAAFTSIFAFSAKVVSVVTTLITVPLVLGYLGADSYGLWLTLSSIALMLGFADLGIGNGVLNLVSEAHGRDDRLMARRAVSSGFFMLSLVGLVLLLGFVVIYRYVPWARVYNVTTPSAMSEAAPATLVFVIVWALSIPVGIVERVQLGYQRGYVNYAWQAVGSLLALGGAYLAIRADAGTPGLVLVLAGGPLLAGILNSVTEYGWVCPWLRPAWSFVSRTVLRRIFRLGDAVLRSTGDDCDDLLL